MTNTSTCVMHKRAHTHAHSIRSQCLQTGAGGCEVDAQQTAVVQPDSELPGHWTDSAFVTIAEPSGQETSAVAHVGG